MTEKFKLKDAKEHSLRTYSVLRYFTMFLVLALIVQFISLPGLLAQETDQHKVTGKVISASDNDPLPGANITIKGTTVGTITDVNGNFSIDAADNDILIVSFMGFLPEEVPVTGQSSVEVSLIEDIARLDEVVVIGYGSAKRGDLTGSVSSVSASDIKKTQPVTLDQALQGKIPGMVVQQVSGQPGGGVSVQIRGISSLTQSTSPMYIIDGVILSAGSTSNGSNPLAAINPSEIESVDVLKDASATAIYGSQATNGVIIITTKRGRTGAPKISYDFYTGFQQLPKKLPVMNLREYATFINKRNTGMGWGFDTRPTLANPEYLGEGTDWQEELFRNAPMSNHAISVGGGDERTQYMFSGSYNKIEGIALGSDFRRISVRLNLDNKTTNWLKIGTSIQFANIKDNTNTSTSNVINEALKQTPDIPVQNTDGSWGGAYNPNGWVLYTVNPYAIAQINKDETERNEMFGNAYAEITFFKDLKLRNEVTGDFRMSTHDKFEPSYTMGIVENLNNVGTYSFGKTLNTTLRNFFTYNHVFIDIVSTEIMAGHEAILNTSENGEESRNNFPSNNVQVINSGDPTTAKNSGSKYHSAQEAYLGRLNVTINNKYLLTGNIRADGSSKFAEGNRWVTTYSGALAWKINNESFFKNVGFVNALKLRLGYGLTNNQSIDDYAYTSSLKTIATGLSGISQLTTTIGNPYVEWEKTKYANIGLDGSFFNYRLNFSVDFYDRKTDGLLMKVALPQYTGISATDYHPGQMDAPWVNVGSVDNKGFDFSINTTNIKKKDFTWKTDITVSHNINKVLKLNTDGASLDGTYSKTVEGRSIGEFYGYQVDGGVFATAEDFETHALPAKNGVKLPVGAAGGSIWYGDLKFTDLNGDTIIDERDQTFLGSPVPKFQIGFNNSFSYKNFDFSIFFNANYGNKVFNQLRVRGEDPGTSFGYLKSLKNYAKLALIDPNGSATDINNVYVVNPDTWIPGVRNDNTNENNRTSDKYIEDGSFIRCKSISLGYTISEKLLQRVHVSSLRVYVNVSNAFIITKYKGMDPEIGSWNPLNAGIDNGYYPQPRVFTGGLNISF